MSNRRKETSQWVNRESVARTAATAAPTRKPYSRPTLTHYGDVRGVTLGSFPGNADSGGLGKPDPRNQLESETQSRPARPTRKE